MESSPPTILWVPSKPHLQLEAERANISWSDSLTEWQGKYSLNLCYKKNTLCKMCENVGQILLYKHSLIYDVVLWLCKTGLRVGEGSFFLKWFHIFELCSVLDGVKYSDLVLIYRNSKHASQVGSNSRRGKGIFSFDRLWSGHKWSAPLLRICRPHEICN